MAVTLYFVKSLPIASKGVYCCHEQWRIYNWPDYRHSCYCSVNLRYSKSCQKEEVILLNVI